jgi:hypothetical protein
MSQVYQLNNLEMSDTVSLIRVYGRRRCQQIQIIAILLPL